MNQYRHGIAWKLSRLPAGVLLASVILLCPTRPAFADAKNVPLPTLRSLVPADAWNELLSQGSAARVGKAGDGLRLVPNFAPAALVRDAITTENPSLLVESLYVYRRDRPRDATAELRSLYGTLLAISSLEGIQYWSATRKTMRTFYAESYRIDGPDTRKRLPDATAPTAGPLPSTETYYSFQRDLTFGPNVYRCGYKTFADAVMLESVNLTSLTYIGIPVMGPNGLRIRLFVIQSDDAILFYAVSSADVPSLPIVTDKVQESITNRTEALFKWFSARQKG
jgi:hypothetical protein